MEVLFRITLDDECEIDECKIMIGSETKMKVSYGKATNFVFNNLFYGDGTYTVQTIIDDSGETPAIVMSVYK